LADHDSIDVHGPGAVGALLAGSLAGLIGVPETVALGGAICPLGAVIFGLRFSHLEKEGREMIVSMQMTGGEPASKAAFQQPS
jgi:hypothetical protein